ncbi:(2Fe-2S)-binding protein [Corynebacterium gerontici]|uniref:Ferric siderophore reductase C-terminal domain-containing protein n=1 Tax=Corynebacterium gerontici TaxID=2079234 RepID=A0A3G6J075_9CORY|nr:(2Fe-2S)-binding protein [Corynebacterium gerontici]AZA11183.1 hypothetical protein CGERO_04330 [Corynebacterium gerontici]
MSLQHAFDRLIAQHERFRPSLTPNTNTLSAAELASRDTIEGAVAECQDIFQLEHQRHAAQLWLYTLLGDVLTPSVMLMVQGEEIPSLNFHNGTLFRREGNFWFGFLPGSGADSHRQAGEELARSLSPVVEGLCEHFAIRPAPLWALIADGVIQPAIAAGNEDFETAKGYRVAEALHEGIAEVAGDCLAPMRVEAIEDSGLVAVDPQHLEAEEPEYLLPHRSSCCMIFHSPAADVCTSCPRQDRQQRIAAQISAIRGF